MTYVNFLDEMELSALKCFRFNCMRLLLVNLVDKFKERLQISESTDLFLWFFIFDLEIGRRCTVSNNRRATTCRLMTVECI